MGRRAKGLLALLGLAVVLVALLWAGGNGPSHGGDDHRAPSSSATSDGSVPLASLPREVAATYRLIQRGGPFPYDRDGVAFRNAEHLLPPQPRGYYHEYTVPTPGPTPGSQDRGARRIVVGDSGEVYYTGDHYRSFVRVETG